MFLIVADKCSPPFSNTVVHAPGKWRIVFCGLAKVMSLRLNVIFQMLIMRQWPNPTILWLHYGDIVTHKLSDSHTVCLLYLNTQSHMPSGFLWNMCKWMGWDFRDKRAENMGKEDNLKRWRWKMRRKPKRPYYTETKGSLGQTQVRCK